MARWWRSHLGIYFLRNVEGDIVPKRPVDFYDVITQQQFTNGFTLASTHFVERIIDIFLEQPTPTPCDTQPHQPTLTRVTQPHPSESFRVKLKNLTKQLPDFQQIEVKLTRTIYYKSVTEQLGNEVIMDVVNQEWISASAINIWIKYVMLNLFLCYCGFLHFHLVFKLQ